jgi:catechol 2,3-dioxygenase-like lactoylglutathione lyase family enzyme
VISYEDISHLGLEVTDLDRAERFYVDTLGMKLLHRDKGELGQGRIVVQNGSGQLLFLEKVDQLSARSRFCGPDTENVPDPGQGVRYKGAHLAISVQSPAEYDEIYPKLELAGCHLEGDILAHRRAAGTKTVYFYDPFGNRLQLIIVPPRDATSSGGGHGHP